MLTYVVKETIDKIILTRCIMKDQYNLLIAIFFILAGGLYRALVVPSADIISANLTPLCAIALFSGTHLTGSLLKYLVPILILFLSDILLSLNPINIANSDLFYPGWFWVYGSIIICVYVSSAIVRKISMSRIILGAISVSVCHWLISDFGYFISGGINILTGESYSPNINGLIESVVMGFPFFKKTLLSTIVFSFFFFYSYEASRHLVSNLKPTTESI